MAGTTPLLALSYPVSTDAASPVAVQTLAGQLEKYLVGVYATTTARDTAWTAAGGLANGALAFITGTGELQLRSAGAWVVIGGRATPFAFAAGTGVIAITTGDASASTTVSLPAGRFAVAPIVTMSATSISAGMAVWQPRVGATTTTTFVAWTVISSGTAASALSFGFTWLAAEMTAAAAAG